MYSIVRTLELGVLLYKKLNQNYKGMHIRSHRKHSYSLIQVIPASLFTMQVDWWLVAVPLSRFGMLDVASLISDAREEHAILRSSLVETATAAKLPMQFLPFIQAWALKSDLNLSGSLSNGPTRDCPLRLCTRVVKSDRLSSPSVTPDVSIAQASKSGRT